MLNWQDRLNPQAGGAETHLHEVFGRLAGRGHQISLLVSSWSGAPARVELDGMQVHRTGSRYTFSTAAPRYYRRNFADSAFNLVIEDLNKVPLFTPLWARHPIALLVHHLFGRTAFQEATLPLAAATWLLERPLAAVYGNTPVTAVSASTADDLAARGFDRNAIEVIPNGVDIATFSPAADERFPEPTVLYLGRLRRYKRIDLIVQAIARLRDEGFFARLVIAGGGDQAEALLQLRARLKLEDRVDLAGFVPEAEKLRLLRGAWVHALTSPKEGWGISNLEAAACGTPTVASDSPGLRDSVVHESTGYLVPHCDVPALAARLRTLLTDRGLRDRMGVAARRYAEQFTWDLAAERNEEFFLDAARATRT